MTFSELIDLIHTNVISAISSLPNEVVIGAMAAFIPLGLFVGSYAIYLNRKSHK